MRRTIISFGTLFNAITVKQTNSSDSIVNTIRVPLSYGPTQKVLARLEQQVDLNKSINKNDAILDPHKINQENSLVKVQNYYDCSNYNEWSVFKLDVEHVHVPNLYVGISYRSYQVTDFHRFLIYFISKESIKLSVYILINWIIHTPFQIHILELEVGPSMNIDDIDYRWVNDRIEYWVSEERLFSKN